MKQEASQSSKRPRFSEVCQRYHLDYQSMQEIARSAGVPKEVVDAMAVSTAVHRDQALKVLAVLSERTGATWTLDNVQVVILPTFKEFHVFHQFDLAILSTTSGVSFDTIDRMLRGEPIREHEAIRILQAASRQTRLYYKFTNVDVALL